MVIAWLEKFGPYVALAVEFVIALIIYIHKCKNASASNEKLKFKQTVLSSIGSFCEEAEILFGKGNGVSKKQWALQQAKLACVKLGIEISDETLENAIEEVIKVTNSINTYKGE